jgi:hypothetical protein
MGNNNHKDPAIVVKNEIFKTTKENVYSKRSSLAGIAGFFEMLLRRFRTASFLAALTPLYIIAILAMGLSATPGVYLINYILEVTKDWYQFFHYAALATSFIAAYFLYGLCIVFVAPFFNFIMPFRLKPFRGPLFSLKTIPWYIHNALTYIVRYTFLEFITPTPLNILFYRMMGMKIGKNVHLNTTNISDPCMIEIEDYVTVGGSVHIIGHYATKGYIVLSRVKIRKGATIGLKATIMGNVEIGMGATIAPHEVVLPKSIIPSNRKPEKQERQTIPFDPLEQKVG